MTNEIEEKVFYSEFQIVVDDHHNTLADIRRYDATLADTFYLKEHPQNQGTHCLCKSCRVSSPVT